MDGSVFLRPSLSVRSRGRGALLHCIAVLHGRRFGSFDPSDPVDRVRAAMGFVGSAGTAETARKLAVLRSMWVPVRQLRGCLVRRGGGEVRIEDETSVTSAQLVRFRKDAIAAQ